ncbi:hypothetical protein [Halodurantibacterium flavum]|uniref:Lipopolysaccharide export system protein LptC n=1 Tax=Halodurantibacterium flavum TaxID=1382802 RepID=A0ABW4S800_9RHOB
MSLTDSGYSRLVTWLKIGLPLIALALLSTLFLFSRTIDPTRAIQFTALNVEELAREPRVTAPRYSGLTSDGSALRVEAATARTDPLQPSGLSGQEVEAWLETPDGQSAAMQATSAAIDQGSGELRLTGAVRLETSGGYDLQSEEVIALLDRTRLVSPGPVQGSAPAGDLEAGAMTLQQAPDGQSYVLVFNEGVRLLYRP